PWQTGHCDPETSKARFLGRIVPVVPPRLPTKAPRMRARIPRAWRHRALAALVSLVVLPLAAPRLRAQSTPAPAPPVWAGGKDRAQPPRQPPQEAAPPATAPTASPLIARVGGRPVPQADHDRRPQPSFGRL